MTDILTKDATLTSSPATLIFAPSGGYLLLKGTVSNTGATNGTVTLYRLLASATAGAANVIVNAFAIAAGATDALPISAQGLMANNILQGKATGASGININLTYATPT